MESAPLTCVFAVNSGIKNHQKKLNIICEGVEGLKLEMSNSLFCLRGKTSDPRIFIKKLYITRSYIELYRIDYGYEENPQGTRKPNSHFMRCYFELDTSDISWYKRIGEALKNMEGVSFTIDVKPVMGNPMVYLCGNIEIGVLMKTLTKTGIELSNMEYGMEYKDANLTQLPKKLEGPQNETETQRLLPPQPHEDVVSTSTKQVMYKKPRWFRRFFC